MTGYIIGAVLGVILLLLQNLKPTSFGFRIASLASTIALLFYMSRVDLGYWNILAIPAGVLILCFLSAFCFPYGGSFALSEYAGCNGIDYYELLGDNDKIGRINAPGFRQTYDRIISGIVYDITGNVKDAESLFKLIYSKNFYPISTHTKEEILGHLNLAVDTIAFCSHHGMNIRAMADRKLPLLFNAYVSVMSIHEEATRNIEYLKSSRALHDTHDTWEDSNDPLPWSMTHKGQH